MSFREQLNAIEAAPVAHAPAPPMADGVLSSFASDSYKLLKERMHLNCWTGSTWRCSKP